MSARPGSSDVLHAIRRPSVDSATALEGSAPSATGTSPAAVAHASRAVAAGGEPGPACNSEPEPETANCAPPVDEATEEMTVCGTPDNVRLIGSKVTACKSLPLENTTRSDAPNLALPMPDSGEVQRIGPRPLASGARPS